MWAQTNKCDGDNMFWSRITCICLQVQVFHGDSVSVNPSTCVLLLYVVWAHLYSMQCLTLTYFQCLQNNLASWRSNCTLWYLSILILRKCTQNCKFDICHSQGNIGEIFVPKRRTDLLLEIIPFSSSVFLKHPYYGFHNFQNDIHLCYFPQYRKLPVNQYFGQTQQNVLNSQLSSSSSLSSSKSYL